MSTATLNWFFSLLSRVFFSTIESTNSMSQHLDHHFRVYTEVDEVLRNASVPQL